LAEAAAPDPSIVGQIIVVQNVLCFEMATWQMSMDNAEQLRVRRVLDLENDVARRPDMPIGSDRRSERSRKL
jgi:hypothetical protein